jgi:hypothetical protein
MNQKTIYIKKAAPTGSRTRATSLEGKDHTVRPLVLSYKLNFFFENNFYFIYF